MQMSPKLASPVSTPPPPKGNPPTPHLWMGSLEKKKKNQLWISRAGISDGPEVATEGGVWSSDINSNAKPGRSKVIISYLLKESQRETADDPS